LIVAPGCPLPEAVHLAERVRKCVCELAIDVPGCTIPVTMSLGVTDTSIAQKADDLPRSADEGLYAAKSGGRNKVEVISDVRIASS
jgi:diguanylate cyclase (GGDEF)-like protein